MAASLRRSMVVAIGIHRDGLPLEEIKRRGDRVGGGLTAPASHTTVRAVRHTAVRDKS
jgi:hypothetical protein